MKECKYLTIAFDIHYLFGTKEIIIHSELKNRGDRRRNYGLIESEISALT
jgi:hypothetical protein